MIFLILAVILFVISAIAWFRLRKKARWYAWDYGAQVYGVIAWFIFKALGVGGELRFSNHYVELFWVFVILMGSPWLRAKFPGRTEAGSRLSCLCFSVLFPIIIAFLIREFTPPMKS